MKRVLLTEPIHESGLALLEGRPDIEIVSPRDASPEAIADAVADVHGIAVRLVQLPSEILAKANSLEVVSRHGVGCDNVAVDHLSGRDIPVMITAGANSVSVAEHTIALLLAAARRLILQDRTVREGRFRERATYRAMDLAGATMLIIGFGRIGRTLAPLCRAFGMEVVVADIALDRELAEEMDCRGVSDFRPELPGADVVSLHVPLDDTTRHLIAAPELAAMKPDAILLNCARGGVVDEAALVAALDSGRLAAAGVDVFSEEPPSENHPLFDRPDVVLTPHNAAASHDSMRKMAEMTAQNILDYFDGVTIEDNIFNWDDLQARKGA